MQQQKYIFSKLKLSAADARKFFFYFGGHTFKALKYHKEIKLYRVCASYL